MYFPTVLLAVVLTYVAADVVHDVRDCQDSSPLCDRLGQLERLLMEQNRLSSQQHHLLHQLQSRLSDQEELNGDLVKKWSQQHDLLRQLQSRLSDQEELNGDLVEKLSQQDGLLLQLQSRVSRQEGQLLWQDKELSHDKQLIRQQTEKLSHQEDLLHQLQFQLSYQESLNHEQDAKLLLQEQLLLPQNMKVSQQGLMTSITHDVIARSDDAGPLEAVVSHMGQQLTEMSADIQALRNSDQVLKTQTDTQIQTLKTETDAEIQTLKNTNAQQNQAIQDARTSTFTHWGSSQCSNASELVYSGVVGGSFYTHSGAATDYLCLTMSPVPSDHGLPSYMTYLYGGEYQTADSHTTDKDPLCSVCRSSHSTTIMIPGTNVCTTGWHQHYDGYLMAGQYFHAAGTEFICVDSKLESRAGSTRNENGALLYFTVTQCGSLPCDPYVNNTVVSCAVCSK